MEATEKSSNLWDKYVQYYKKSPCCIISKRKKKKYYLKKQGTTNVIVKCIEYLICTQDNGLKTSKWDYLV